MSEEVSVSIPRDVFLMIYFTLRDAHTQLAAHDTIGYLITWMQRERGALLYPTFKVEDEQTH